MLITTVQAAERLGVGVRQVQLLIKSKRLRASRFGRASVIDSKDLRAVKIRKIGRPKKGTGMKEHHIEVKVRERLF